VTLYRNAQAGECPLVVDKTTPSCGNSRFGCWVCTVVTKDTSMEAMIENGEEWLEPLLKYRDLLASTQDPVIKGEWREFKRRNGRVTTTPDGRIVPGPYRLEKRKLLLRELLKVQKQVRTTGPNPQEQLISSDELEEIRRIWRSEEQDWEDSLPRIYREVTGKDLEWIADEGAAFSTEDRRILDTICARHNVPSPMVAKLLDVERQHHGMTRRSSVHQRIAAVFEEDWRSDEEILRSTTKPAS
jgi:DNA sulfur modification protein DndC